MLIGGLTGGIGSGKSQVASLFQALGVAVVDADRVSREIMQPGETAFDQVVAHFGPLLEGGVLDAVGQIDRKKLGELVFAAPEHKRALELITHPQILLRSMQKLHAAAEQKPPYALYEAALLVENGSYKQFPFLLVVIASEANQRARVRARDGLSDAEIEQRFAAQASTATKAAVADYVIENDGDLAQLGAEVRRVHDAILARFASASSASG